MCSKPGLFDAVVIPTGFWWYQGLVYTNVNNCILTYSSDNVLKQGSVKYQILLLFVSQSQKYIHVQLLCFYIAYWPPLLLFLLFYTLFIQTEGINFIVQKVWKICINYIMQ